MSRHRIVLTSRFQRERAAKLVFGAPDGFIADIREPTRTGEQNDKMWAMLTDISHAKPLGRRHTPDVWKCLFMAACGHAVQFETGLDGQPFPIGFRSSRLSKAQMSDLIEFIFAWCAEKGVQLSEAA